MYTYQKEIANVQFHITAFRMEHHVRTVHEQHQDFLNERVTNSECLILCDIFSCMKKHNLRSVNRKTNTYTNI